MELEIGSYYIQMGVGKVLPGTRSAAPGACVSASFAHRISTQAMHLISTYAGNFRACLGFISRFRNRTLTEIVA